jgi:L-aminopeptidase/D-esterase-like protein
VLTEVPGVRVGHWTDEVARTGCTVVRLPEGTVASGEVRGGAPATREFALLDPQRLVARLDAVVLSGGSAFGLAAADGVMRILADEGVGFPTGAGPVPIVVGLSLFDLLVGDGSVRPGAEQGYAAAAAASSGPVALGRVGAGAGATVGKWRGPEHVRDGGLVAAAVHHGELVVAAMAAVNAFGGVTDDLLPPAELPGVGEAFGAAPGPEGTNTTLVVVVTNARLDKLGCHLVAQGAHHGLARCISPSHTRFDGDAVVAAATGGLGDDAAVDVDVVRLLATHAVERAVRTLDADREPRSPQ